MVRLGCRRNWSRRVTDCRTLPLCQVRALRRQRLGGKERGSRIGRGEEKHAPVRLERAIGFWNRNVSLVRVVLASTS